MTFLAICLALFFAWLIGELVPEEPTEAPESRHRIEAEYDRLRRGDA